MELNRVENNANRGREITRTYFNHTIETGVYSRTRTEEEVEGRNISLKPLGKINPDIKKIKLDL